MTQRYDSSLRQTLWTIAVLVALAACGGKKKPAAASPGATTVVAVDATRASSDPDELLRATRLPHTALLKAVGPHKLTVSSTLKAAGETLDETLTLSVDDKGAFHFLHDNSRDYGKEVVLTGELLYIRPRYGKYLERPAEKDEGLRLRDEAYGMVGAYLDVVGFAVATKSSSKVTVAGRPALQVVLGLASPARAIPAVPADHPERKWRETVAPISIDGTVTLDQATAVPLAADLKLHYKLTRDGQPIDTELGVTLTLTDIGVDPRIAAPGVTEYVEIPTRPRPQLERDQLLGRTGADDGGTP